MLVGRRDLAKSGLPQRHQIKITLGKFNELNVGQGFARHHGLCSRLEFCLKSIGRREREVRHVVPKMQVAHDHLKGPGLEPRWMTEIAGL